MIYVMIPGKPVPQGRGRVITVAGHGAIADPAKSRSWKGVAQVHMQQQCPTPLEGPLEVQVLAKFPCPGSDYRKREKRPRRWHTKSTGDADNILKACLDAGNGVLWEDDRQVAKATVVKIIAAQEENSAVIIAVGHLGQYATEKLPF
jgi:Holliday junction resolvase RusA-like endonuclease